MKKTPTCPICHRRSTMECRVHNKGKIEQWYCTDCNRPWSIHDSEQAVIGCGKPVD